MRAAGGAADMKRPGDRPPYLYRYRGRPVAGSAPVRLADRVRCLLRRALLAGSGLPDDPTAGRGPGSGHPSSRGDLGGRLADGRLANRRADARAALARGSRGAANGSPGGSLGAGRAAPRGGLRTSGRLADDLADRGLRSRRGLANSGLGASDRLANGGLRARDRLANGGLGAGGRLRAASRRALRGRLHRGTRRGLAAGSRLGARGCLGASSGLWSGSLTWAGSLLSLHRCHTGLPPRFVERSVIYGDERTVIWTAEHRIAQHSHVSAWLLSTATIRHAPFLLRLRAVARNQMTRRRERHTNIDAIADPAAGSVNSPASQRGR
jgi:hypothetical protein